jgi:hypothetical protein
VAGWGEFSLARPDLAEGGRNLFYQHGVGLAFLATVRADGGPRLHPMCPVFDLEELFAFIVPSPKQRDLLRDGRYAMHSFPCPENEDAFYMTGVAVLVDDALIRARLSHLFVSEREAVGVPPPPDTELLFRFEVETCVLTRTKGHGDPQPVHTIWHSTPLTGRHKPASR